MITVYFKLIIKLLKRFVSLVFTVFFIEKKNNVALFFAKLGATKITNQISGILNFTKPKSSFRLNFLSFLAFILFFSVSKNSFGQTATDTYSTAGTFTWVCPPGVTSITVQAWGGGGAGGRGYTTNGASGGGGGGGAFAQSTLAVTPGASYVVVTGAGGLTSTTANGGAGQLSSFASTSVIAQGGSGGIASITNAGALGGAGGAVATSTGTIKWAGGAGGTGVAGTLTASGGGGGGAAAATTSVGAAGSGRTGGVGVAPSGSGGNGAKNTSGAAGSTFGGGGAGGNRSNTTTNAGSAGARGCVRIIYPAYNMPASGSASVCAGVFYDSGGSAAQYGASENRTFTFYPGTAGRKIKVVFSSFAIEAAWDGLMIYNGASTASPLISSGLPLGSAASCPAGSWQGSGSPGTKISTSADGALTFVFTSDGSGFGDWVASIQCVDPPSITSFSATSVCAGSTFTINGNYFTEATAVSINGVAATQTLVNSNTAITVTVPATATTGTVSVTSPNGTGVSSGSLTVLNIPATPGSITRPANICGGSTNNAFSITAVSGASSYSWTVSGTGWAVTSGSATASASITAGSVTGTVSVYSINSCGTSAVSSVAITPTLAPVPGSITGPTSFCAGSSGLTYSAVANAGATSYTWTVPSGASITSGQGTNTIVVTFGSTSGNVAVTGTGACGTSSATSLAVTLASPTTPSVAISASPSGAICAGTNVAFTAVPSGTNGASVTDYNWKVNGTSVQIGAGNTYNTTGLTNSQQVSCVITVGPGCVSPSTATSNTLTITVNALPTAVTVSGGGAFCNNTTLTAAGGTGGTMYYQGNTSGGTSITTAATSSVVSSSGTYYFRARSAAGCWGTEGSAVVTINTAPIAPVASAASAIGSSTFVANWAAAAGATSYSLDVSTANNFSSFVSGFNNLSVGNVLTYNVTGLSPSTTYYYRVRASNTCGTSASSNTITVATTALVYCTPSFPTGTEPICNVTLNTLNNNSASCAVGGASYTNYTGSVAATDLIHGNTYTISVSGNTDGSFTDYINVFFDFNQNGLFTDAGESFNIGTIVNCANCAVSNTITIPNTASIGTVRMRVVKKYNAYGVACETAGYGEAEDYIVNIRQSYKATFTNMNLGSASWCAGEVRTVSVTVTNAGTATWTNSGPDVNIGAKWNGWSDFHVRTDANNLAAGASATYTLSLQASNTNTLGAYTTALAAGNNNVVFDIVNEGNCWFSANSGFCGTGNSIYTSPTQTIIEVPQTPGSISGSPSFCNNATGLSYSIAAVSGATNYTWTVPSGATVASGQGTNSITVNFGTLSGNITVKAGNSCGTTATVALAVSPTAPTTPSLAITASPSGSICAGTSVTFSATASGLSGSTVTNYNWLLGGVSQQSGASNIYTNNTLANGNLISCSVTISAGCVTTTTATSNILTMTVGAVPNAVTVSGGGAVCGSATLTATDGVGGTIYYQGTTSGGTSAATATASTVVSSANTYYFRARGSNGCWGTEGSAVVTINSAPSPSSFTLTGTTAINCGLSTTFTASPTASLLVPFTGNNSITAGNSTVLYDHGGTGTYANNASGYTVINNSGSNVITLSGVYALETGWDFLRIYDGVGTASLLQTYQLTAGGAVSFTSNPGQTITVGFTSDGSTVNSGFQIDVNFGSYNWYNSLTGGTLLSSSNPYTTPTLTTNTTFYATSVINGCESSPRSSIAVSLTYLTPAVSITSSTTSICAGTSLTFTATPTNGGTTPSYQWKLNGANVGTNSANYTNSALTNGQIVSCVMTSNDACASPTTATSNSITISVTPVSVGGTASSDQTICNNTQPANITLAGNTGTIQWQSSANNSTWNPISGATASPLTSAQMGALTAITYYRANVTNGICSSAPSNTITISITPVSVAGAASTSQTICTGNSPSGITLASNTGTIQWQSSANNSTWTAVSGATLSTLSTVQMGALTATNYYRAVVTNGVCSAANSNTVTVTVSPVSAVGLASSSQTICSGAQPANITLASSTGAVQWQSSTDNITFNNIVGATAATLTGAQAGSLSATTYYKAVVTSSPCSAVTSNVITITVNPLVAPTVTITSDYASICSGTKVTFNATPTNGGAAPTYLWYLNGTSTGLGTATYTNSTLTNGAVVSCSMTSNYACRSVNTANSNSITISVVSFVTPVVSISAPTNSICSGTSVTFTAVPTAGGPAPTYQWKLGGTNVGTNSLNYTNAGLTNGQIVSCFMTSNDACASPSTATSNSVTMTVNAMPTITASTPSFVCGSGAVTLGATASAGTINWYSLSSGGTSLATGTAYTTASLSSTQNYYVDATVAGCTTSSRTTITASVNAIPSNLNTSAGSRCGTGTVVLGATYNSGTINWYDALTAGTLMGTGTSFTTPSISSTTNYYVSSTLNGCTSSPRILVAATVNSIPTITSTTPGSTCGAGLVVLGATASAGTVNWYAVSSGSTSLATGNSYTTPSISSNTTYYVDATATGCTTSTRTAVLATYNAIPTAVTVSGGGTVCGSTTLTATGGSGGTIYYQSTTSAGTSVATATTSQVISSSGTYYFRANNAGCWGIEGSAVVSVIAIPSAPTLVSANPSTVCLGLTTTLTATSAGNTINWYDAPTGGTFLSSSASGANYTNTPSAAGTYTFFAQSTNSVAAGSYTANYSGSIVTWTVPAGVTSINISAKGAQGGSANTGTGGLGAIMTGAFSVTPGQVLSILVGQQPTGGTYAGGGGGTFVGLGATYTSATPMIVAGGGGGAYTGTGGGASTGTSGNGPVPGTSGNGAGSTSCGGGGGGFYTSGLADNGFSGGGSAGGGAGFWQGGAGGTFGTYQPGGFGGGAAANYASSCNNRGGAGGGYSGGSGINSGTLTDIGFGGGSFNGGTSQSSSVANTGNGQVIISWSAVAGCSSTTRTPVTVTVSPVPGAVSVSGGGTSCALAVLAATGGTSGTIYWQNTTANGVSTATAATSQTVTASGTYYYRAQSAGGCWGAQGSATVTITTPSVPAVAISSGNTIFCGIAPSPITYTAVPTNGGSSPTYAWYLNGVLQSGSTTTFVISSPANGDDVNCTMTSNLSCVAPATATSNIISTTSFTSTPSNDECNTATTLTVGITDQGSTGCSSASTGYTTCAGTADDDVWFSFVATQTNHIVNVIPQGNFRPVVQGYSGSCGAFTQLSCGTLNTNIHNSTELSGLSIGQPYFIRIYGFGTGSATQGNFSIEVTTRCVTLATPTVSNNSPVCVGGNVNLINSDAPASLTFSNTTSGSITDLAWVERKIQVSNTGLLANQLNKAVLNIAHTYGADLDIYLVSPSGSKIELSTDNGVGANFTNTTFSTSGTAITAGASPFNGTYIPEQAFSTLTGAADGAWVLQIFDDAGGDVGTFSNIALTFTGTPTLSWAGPNSFTSAANDPTVTAVVAGSAGTYTFTQTYANGCTNSANTIVSVVADPAVSAQPISTQTLCLNGTPQTLNVTGTGGTPSLSYQWYSNTSASTVGATNLGSANGGTTTAYTASTSASGTTYYYAVLGASGNGCTSVNTNFVSVVVSPNPTNPTLAAKTPTMASVCEGATVSATFNSGTNGVGCSDVFEYSTNGSTWTTYTAGSSLSTTGISNGGVLQIRGVRGSCGAGLGCTVNTPTVLATWTINAAPTTAVAGSNQTNCNVSAFVMAANTPAIGTGSWTVIGGSATITNATSPSATITVLAANTATLQWTISNGACASSSSQVVLTNNALPTTAAAGADQFNCNNTTFTLAATNPSSGSGVWSLISGSATITNVNSNSSTVTGLAAGTSATLRWTTSNGTCSNSTDDVVLTNYQLPTTAAAGSDKFNCNSGTFSMAANTPAVGTGVWSLIAGSATIVSPSSPASSITGVPTGSTATLRWTITNGTCSSSTDDIIVTNYSNPTTSNAGSNQANCGSGSFTLAGNNPSSGTGLWVVTSGTATITNPNLFNSTVTGVPAGSSAVLTWSITNGTCAASTSSVTLVNSIAPSVASAGAGQNICGTSLIAAANTPTSGTGTWSLVSGPNSPNFVSVNSASTSIGNLITGTYVLQWSISSLGCTTSTSQVTHTITTTALTATAGVDQSKCGSGTFTLTGNTPSSGSGSWSVVSGTATISNPTSVTTTITGVPAGSSATLQWAIVNGACSASDQVVITNNAVPAMTSTNALTICSGAAVNLSLTSNVASTYTWIANNESTTTGESITTQTATTIGDVIVATSALNKIIVYTITPTAVTGGCVGSNQTVSVTVRPPLMASITGTSAACSSTINEVLSANATATVSSYQWYLNNSLISGATAANYTATVNGNYHVVLGNSSSCSYTSTTYSVSLFPILSSTVTSTDASI